MFHDLILTECVGSVLTLESQVVYTSTSSLDYESSTAEVSEGAQVQLIPFDGAGSVYRVLMHPI